MADPQRDEPADPSAAPSPSGHKRISLPPPKSKAELDAMDWCNDRTKEALGQGFGFMPMPDGPAPVRRITRDGVEYLDITAQHSGIGIVGVGPEAQDYPESGEGTDHDQESPPCLR
jgi:hypothetical protein